MVGEMVFLNEIRPLLSVLGSELLFSSLNTTEPLIQLSDPVPEPTKLRLASMPEAGML